MYWETTHRGQRSLTTYSHKQQQGRDAGRLGVEPLRSVPKPSHNHTHTLQDMTCPLEFNWTQVHAFYLMAQLYAPYCFH